MDYIEERNRICMACPICDTDNYVCRSSLYLNPNNNDISTIPKEGYIKGCGCLLKYKIKNINKKCPAGKW